MKITRTITTATCLATILHKDGKVEEREVTVVGETNQEKIEKALTKQVDAKAVAINKMTFSEHLYEMEAETFVANAVKVEQTTKSAE